jgi:hypothetical protein
LILLTPPFPAICRLYKQLIDFTVKSETTFFIFKANNVETLLHPSPADWALAKRREKVLSKLGSRALIQKPAPRSSCRVRWFFGSWPDTGMTDDLGLCFCAHPAESGEAEGFNKRKSR